MGAAGHGAGEGAGAAATPTVKLWASHGTLGSSFPSMKKGAVSASPSLRDYWELKMPILIERGCQRDCAHLGLLFIIVPYFVASLDAI